MKKKMFLIFVMAFSLLAVTGCEKKQENKKKYTKSALVFKEKYESLNGKKNSKGKKYRSVNIPKDNPFEEITAEEVLNKIENGDTFYVYFGDAKCPWCRSVIEKAIEVANNHKIKKIYYVSIWDDKGNEILRDTYELGKKNKPKKVLEGTDTYYKLLEKFDSVLTEYTLNDSEENEIKVGEKRIYAPNFIYIKKGEVKELVEGISDRQEDPREELTTEMLVDEEYLFDDFFTN